MGAIQDLFSPYPIQITSGYRCPELNVRVGGVEASQHTLGLAADWICPEAGTPWELAHKVAQAGIEFDQLILEFNRWVHISAAPQDRPPRREILSIFSSAEGYLNGLHKRE
jgi:zinc D-Ala-D-Ala carboxypeptidase